MTSHEEKEAVIEETKECNPDTDVGFSNPSSTTVEFVQETREEISNFEMPAEETIETLSIELLKGNSCTRKGKKKTSELNEEDIQMKEFVKAFLHEQFDEIDGTPLSKLDLSTFQEILNKQFRDRHLCIIREDKYTKKKYRLLNQANVPGLGNAHRGVGVMYEDAPIASGKGVVLLVSEYPGIVVLESERKDYVARGNFILNNKGFSFYCRTMKVNARNLLAIGIPEKANVSLRILHSETLRDTYQIVVDTEGFYAVVTSIRPILPGSFLIVQDYGATSGLYYGSRKFLECQKEALSLYNSNKEIVKSNKLVGATVCSKCCMILYSKDLKGNKRNVHNIHCKSFVDNLISQKFGKHKTKNVKHV